MLDSTTWLDREAREVFITALLMARPHELEAPAAQIKIHSLRPTGWKVPPGWYGFVAAAGIGIVARAGIEMAAGLSALERLGSPEPDSRSRDFDGRRLVRIDGGFIILNFMKHWDRDETGAERQRRYRQRQAAIQQQKAEAARHAVTNVTSRNEVTNKNVEVAVDTEAMPQIPPRVVDGEVGEIQERRTKNRRSADARGGWVAALAAIWCTRYEVKTAPFGMIGKHLKPLKDSPDLTRRFAAYLAATELKYVSLPKFRDTFEAWGNGKKPPQSYDYTPGLKGPSL